MYENVVASISRKAKVKRKNSFAIRSEPSERLNGAEGLKHPLNLNFSGSGSEGILLHQKQAR